MEVEGSKHLFVGDDKEKTYKVPASEWPAS
jgi:hypothetical protein